MKMFLLRTWPSRIQLAAIGELYSLAIDLLFLCLGFLIHLVFFAGLQSSFRRTCEIFSSRFFLLLIAQNLGRYLCILRLSLFCDRFLPFCTIAFRFFLFPPFFATVVAPKVTSRRFPCHRKEGMRSRSPRGIASRRNVLVSPLFSLISSSPSAFSSPSPRSLRGLKVENATLLK